MVISRVDFGAKTTADELVEYWKDEIKGKTILITGVSPNSLGAECVVSLAAAAPKLLILAGRNLAKVAETSARILAQHPDTKIKTLELDLASKASSWKSGKEFMSWDDVPSVDILYNNAAIAGQPYQKNTDGFEATFGTNHIGTFIFTMAILDKVIAAKTATFSPRIINVSSAGHRFGGVNFEDPNFEDGKTYEKWKAYGQSKTANMLFSVALADKLKGKGVLSYSFHPGTIYGTNLTAGVAPAELEHALAEAIRQGRPPKNIQEGTATYIAAGFDPEITGDNGAYLSDCKISPPLAEWAAGQDNANRLWKLSEECVGQKFDL